VDIKQHLDFAVLGRFVAARPSTLPLRTSANQVLRLLGDRYREEQFKPLEFEVHIEAQGLTQITGFPLVGLPL
jgi:anaerobic ribonucleoside-triphosphate reductase activating protein